MKSILITFLLALNLSVQLSVAQDKDKSSTIIPVNTKFEKGVIENSYKTGVWEYYDKPGELSLAVDYTSLTIPFMKRDTTGIYAIEKNGIWVQSTLDVQPRYLGSMGEFYDMIVSTLLFPTAARSKNTSGTVYIMFEVDTKGKADNFSLVKDIGDGCAEEVIRILKFIPNLWIVASKDNVSYKSRFIVPVTFSYDNGKYIIKNKKDTTELPVSTKLSEVSIVAYKR